MSCPTPHIHAAVIKAWADGHTIQFRDLKQYWVDCASPSFDTSLEYRIKPMPKPNVVKYAILGIGDWDDARHPHHNIKLTFNGETGNLVAADLLE
jgi:hypothetical protein